MFSCNHYFLRVLHGDLGAGESSPVFSLVRCFCVFTRCVWPVHGCKATVCFVIAHTCVNVELSGHLDHPC